MDVRRLCTKLNHVMKGSIFQIKSPAFACGRVACVSLHSASRKAACNPVNSRMGSLN